MELIYSKHERPDKRVSGGDRRAVSRWFVAYDLGGKPKGDIALVFGTRFARFYPPGLILPPLWQDHRDAGGNKGDDLGQALMSGIERWSGVSLVSWRR